MARLDLIERYGEAAVNNGYRVYTTIDSRLQTAAERALRIGLLEYDRRHGYRGALKRAAVKPGAAVEALEDALDAIPNAGNLKAAVVVSVTPKSARVYVGGQGYSQIEWSGMSWARGGGDATAESIVQAGDIVYVISTGKTAELVQLPLAQGALVSLDPDDGALVAMVGGFDYAISKFNRATQAARQPGSGFKPFLYSAALEHGFTPASIIMDAPIMADDQGAETNWRPQNSGGEFSGPMRLREGLVLSRNLVSIRLLRGTGAGEVIDYAARFGFPARDLPRNETLALGTMSATPVTVANAYATFANGGYRVNWYFIDRIENENGEVVYRAEPKRVCEACEPDAAASDASASALVPAPALPAPASAPARARKAAACLRDDGLSPLVDDKHRAPRVISAANAWLMDDMMGEAVRRGTGRGAMVLGRNDLGGKTGTTNDERDTWFNGFNRHLVASVWVGFDQSTPLGAGEQGARTAVPIWVTYMREALRGTPDVPRPRPEGLVTARISAETGMLLPEGAGGGMDETFLAGHLPEMAAPGDAAAGNGTEPGGEALF
jgi:penicillin-binding protein 1A